MPGLLGMFASNTCGLHFEETFKDTIVPKEEKLLSIIISHLQLESSLPQTIVKESQENGHLIYSFSL